MRPLFLLALVWCSISAGSPSTLRAAPGGNSPAQTTALGVPDIRCSSDPSATKGTLRHRRSSLVTSLGDPRHRGIDLVAAADAERQVLRAKISYGKVHKDLEDEDVELFACNGNAWIRLGAARTDGNGELAFTLEGDDRLPTGMRELYASVVGDRTGVRFLAYVAPTGTRTIISDVDGTLTASESAFVKTVIVGKPSKAQAGAPAALQLAADRGYQPVYITARGEQFTEATRAWLEAQGFPRGPILLADTLVTTPGPDTVRFKTDAMRAVTRGGLTIGAGVGNRATDVAAYEALGLAPDRIFVMTTEFAGELADEVKAGRATGFSSYNRLAADHLAKLPSSASAPPSAPAKP